MHELLARDDQTLLDVIDTELWNFKMDKDLLCELVHDTHQIS